jgi:hypothetical protein
MVQKRGNAECILDDKNPDQMLKSELSSVTEWKWTSTQKATFLSNLWVKMIHIQKGFVDKLDSTGWLLKYLKKTLKTKVKQVEIDTLNGPVPIT